MKIQIYTTNTCHYCKDVKNLIKSLGFDYEEKNVSLDNSLKDDLLKLSGRMSVPVTLIGEQVIVGFKEEEIREALK